MNKNSHLPGLLRVTAAMVALATGLLLSVALVSAAQATVSERSPRALEPARDAAPVALPTTASKAPFSPNGPIDPAGIERLVNATNGAVTVSLHRATGAARFVRVAADQPGALSALLGPTASAEEQAAAFFAEYGSIFGIADAGVQLSLIETKTDGLGTTRLLYRQVHNGVSVFAGLVLVHFNKANQLTAINGTFIPAIALNPTASVTADSAAATAVALVNADLSAGSPALTIRQTKLYVYRVGLAKGVDGPSVLAYEVEVTNGANVRDFVYINAHTSAMVDRVSGVVDALFRRVYDGGYGPTFQVWEEGDPFPFVGVDVTQTVNVNNILSGTLETYNLFFNAFGRDSYDGAGAEMEAVNNDPTINCPNANWNGTSTNYCNDVTGDDTVAHEWGHAYTEYTHNLIYAWQPGALNEAYSDIWGEVVDLINGRGLDSPGGTRTVGACSVYTQFPAKLVINAPPSIAGDYEAQSASFGPALTVTGTTGTVVLGEDGTGSTIPGDPSPSIYDACEPLTNGAAISGNVALVYRGTCNFTVKVKNAQDAGATAVIVANRNNADGLPGMGGADDTIVIPSLGISYADGEAIRVELSNTVDATLTVDTGGVPPEDSYRWLSGEDDPAFGGAIRDMWTPGCYGDPGEVIEDNYFCSTDDGGGVHSNSGVPNHAFALLVDGGVHNGITVTAINLTKTAHIYFRAQSVYQVSTTDFADHADALETSCTDLIGVDLNDLNTGLPSGEIISAADCTEVGDAMDAVEMRDDPTAQCAFEPLLDPNPPALCAAGTGSLVTVFTDTLEVDPSSTWTVSHTDVYSATTFDWVWDSTLPGGRTGSAFYGPDPTDDGGDCSLGIGDVSRVMYLTSPVITLPVGTTVSRLAFEHYVATEAGYDGGNVKVSVNGGPWTLVEAGDYDFNAYNATLLDTNPLAGEAGFSGTDGGQVTGSWGQSLVDLRNYAGPGDSVQLQFELGTDGCAGIDGWYVDNVEVYYCDSESNAQAALSATSVSSIQSPGYVTTKTVTLSNTGTTSMTWSLLEGSTSLPATQHRSQAGSGTAGSLTRNPIADVVAFGGSPSAPLAPSAALTLTQSLSQTITDLNSIACADPILFTTLDNSYIRVFNLDDHGVTGSFAVSSVDIGIEYADDGGGTGQPIEVYLYTLDGALSFANMTLIGSASYTITDQVLTIVNLPVSGVAAAHSQLVVEVYIPDGTAAGHFFWPGSNAEGQTAPSYLASVACGLTDPIDIAAIGFPDMHLVMNVYGNDQACTPLDYPWLSAAPAGGTILPDQSTDISVVFDSTSLTNGTYSGNVCVSTNDADDPVLAVSAVLDVQQLHLPIITK